MEGKKFRRDKHKVKAKLRRMESPSRKEILPSKSGLLINSKRIKKGSKEESKSTKSDKNYRSIVKLEHSKSSSVLQFSKDALNSIPKGLNILCDKNLFEGMIYPIQREMFFEQFFTQKVLHISGSPVSRFQNIISEHLFDLNIRELIENSERIFIWFPKKQEAKSKSDKSKEESNPQGIKSQKVDEPELAYNAFKYGGASLYLGSSQEFREQYCKQLAYQLGMNFTSYYPDFTSMSEIEIFVSKKGNYTDFHIDFQENFSLQIAGSKKWRVLKSGLKYPILGFSPHYHSSGNLQEQVSAHQGFNNIDICSQYDKKQLEAMSDEIIVNPGDILYHPAGIWHSVECISDESISVNFSLTQLRYADLIGNIVKMNLLKQDEFRAGVRFDNFNQLNEQISRRMNNLAQYLPSFSDPLPQCLEIPRIREFQLDMTIEEQGKRPQGLQITLQSRVRPSRIGTMIKISSLPQIPEDAVGAQYISNVLFATDDYQGQSRVLLFTKNQETIRLCDYFIKESLSEHVEVRDVKKVLKDLNVKQTAKALNVLRNLEFNGVIVQK